MNSRRVAVTQCLDQLVDGFRIDIQTRQQFLERVDGGRPFFIQTVSGRKIQTLRIKKFCQYIGGGLMRVIHQTRGSIGRIQSSF